MPLETLRSVVVLNPESCLGLEDYWTGELEMGGVRVVTALIPCAAPAFDAQSIEDRDRVLIEVLAFSCNYRDRCLLLEQLRRGRGAPIHFGSDFAAIVREVGSNVQNLIVGDRVIGNNSYPIASIRGCSPGVATNSASSRYLVLHECKLAKIPEEMPLSVAAGFSVGAQTCGSMIRKLDVKSGSRCLVTGASSNTSLFALSLLRQHGVETYALTTGLGSFAALGVRGTIRASAPLEDSLSSNEIVRKVMREHGGFDIVIDPFADVYATSMIPLLRHGGKYITCGIHAQVGVTPFHSVDSIVWRDMLAHAITNNVTIFANCLGTEADLDETIRAWRSVADGLPIEAMLQERESLEFVATTFLRARFGKVILAYSASTQSLQVELERRQATAALQQ